MNHIIPRDKLEILGSIGLFAILNDQKPTWKGRAEISKNQIDPVCFLNRPDVPRNNSEATDEGFCFPIVERERIIALTGNKDETLLIGPKT